MRIVREKDIATGGLIINHNSTVARIKMLTLYSENDVLVLEPYEHVVGAQYTGGATLVAVYTTRLYDE